MSRIKKQLAICPPAYMCKGPNRENFVSTGHKCGYCKGNGWFWGTEEGSREDVHVSCPVCGGSGELDAIITSGLETFKQVSHEKGVLQLRCEAARSAS